MGVDLRITHGEIALLLASAVGEEKSAEIVIGAARALGFSGKTFTIPETKAIFERLAEAEGLVGVAARLAIRRGDLDVLVATTPSGRHRIDTPPRAARVDVAARLAPSLGEEKARDAVETAAKRLGLDPRRLGRDDALAVLDELAKEEGIVGVVARFAKERFVLEPSR